jgi:hypothetical protein
LQLSIEKLKLVTMLAMMAWLGHRWKAVPSNRLTPCKKFLTGTPTILDEGVIWEESGGCRMHNYTKK